MFIWAFYEVCQKLFIFEPYLVISIPISITLGVLLGMLLAKDKVICQNYGTWFTKDKTTYHNRVFILKGSPFVLILVFATFILKTTIFTTLGYNPNLIHNQIFAMCFATSFIFVAGITFGRSIGLLRSIIFIILSQKNN